MITYLSIRDFINVSNLVRVIGIALLVVCCLGCYERYSGFNVQSLLPEKYENGENRFHKSQSLTDVTATYNHRILFGIACACSLLYWSLKLNTRFTNRQTLGAFTATAISGAALYFSLSRNPWLAVFISYMYLLLLYPKYILPKVALLLLLCSCLFIVRPGVFGSMKGSVAATVSDNNPKATSANYRILVWKAATKAIFSSGLPHALFGFGGTGYMYLRLGEVEIWDGHYAELESWDSQTAIDLTGHGFVGFGLIVFLYLQVMLACHYYLKSGGVFQNEMLFCMGSILVLVISKLSVAFFSPQLVYLESILIGMSSAMIFSQHSKAAFQTQFYPVSETGSV